MNTEKLHALIQRYEDGLDWIYGQKHDELFKWRAMATWRREWLKPAERNASRLLIPERLRNDVYKCDKSFHFAILNCKYVVYPL